MYDFSKIKLVIWDLDNTLWDGIISEGSVAIPETNKNLIRRLADMGVMNSICSKNDFDLSRARLEEEGLWELFVFPSINWEPKGQRVAAIIDNMGLRQENALFIDDNISNLEESRFYRENIATAVPGEIENLYKEALKRETTDKDHKRLKQYKVLEEKQTEKEKFSSNIDFLYESSIELQISKDCLNRADRIEELILRTNQLNFTKLRSTKEELLDLLRDESFDCGYVNVRDKFGDYGIAGFYALNKNENRLVHFCFSCRVLGMGIEQYVYNTLNRPSLTINGEVRSSLSSKDVPGWINKSPAPPASAGREYTGYPVERVFSQRPYKRAVRSFSDSPLCRG